ncbi:hypothetical protein KEM52_004668 [Ascosphaera acerosa]|nr:hypothetical protein KEM52_004668 [Ascosphaera acerosa]
MFSLPTTSQATASAKERRKCARRSLNDLSQEIHAAFTQHLTPAEMLATSDKICAQIRENARFSDMSMLPSFIHTLPTGSEIGTFLALDVGGSTLRVSLIELSGKEQGMHAILSRSVLISEEVKKLKGKRFFAWMAEQIDETLSSDGHQYGYGDTPLLTGLSWSFPIEQTSVGGGRILPMGKGFLCSDDTIGMDLGDLITEACAERDLKIKVAALVNDSSATLLSKAYLVPTTRISLIVGTGTNAAIHFPVQAISPDKYGQRSAEWFADAERVIVNSELSVFGGDGIFKSSRWDDYLDQTHNRPGYQPLEYMAAGRYLGEIVRLIIVEAVQTTDLFGGLLPHSMKEPYSFDTSLVSTIEADTSPGLSASSSHLQTLYTFVSPPTAQDMAFLKGVCIDLSNRATAYIAIAVYSLWRVCSEHERGVRTPDSSSAATNPSPISVACDGALILKYSGFRERCQKYLDRLVDSASSPQQHEKDIDLALTLPASSSPALTLDIAVDDSTIYGAAVAAAVAAST